MLQAHSQPTQLLFVIIAAVFLYTSDLDSIAVSLFGNMTVEIGEIHIITKE